MDFCRGSYARSHTGVCYGCGAVFDPPEVDGLCMTIPFHSPEVWSRDETGKSEIA